MRMGRSSSSIIPGRRAISEENWARGTSIFSHPDYIDHTIEDIYALAQNQREALRIVLGTGHKVTGTVFDAAGKPVPNATIKAVRKDGSPCAKGP